MANLKKLSIQSVVYKMIMVLLCAWLCRDASASFLIVNVPEGSANIAGDFSGPVEIRKIGAGTAVYTANETYTGVTNIFEGTLENNGSMQSSAVNVSSGTSCTGTGEILVLNNSGNVGVAGEVGSTLTVHDYRPASSSSTSIRLNASAADYLSVDTTVLTGALKVYVDRDVEYPPEGTIYRIIRGGDVSGVIGSGGFGFFSSIVNANEADVAFDYEYDANEFCLVVLGGVPYIQPTSTVYSSGLLLNGVRRDTIEIGSAGGFSGFTIPDSACKTLHMGFMQSGTIAAPNSILTNSYTGSGSVPHLPTTLDDLWIEGDATGFDALVLNGLQYALPTPAANTTIHFFLSSAPASSPLAWFQGALPSGCRLVIEPGSADPFINTVLPMAGGKIIIGAPVAPAVGFSTLLHNMTRACPIQRHPRVPVGDAATQALITLAEATTFPYAVNGINLAGGYATTFTGLSDLVDPTTASASAGYTVSANSTLHVFRSHGHAVMPEISMYLTPGGTSNFEVVLVAEKLPDLHPPLN